MAIEKLELPKRLDEERIAALKDLFPEVFADGRVNVQALQEALADIAEDGDVGDEHYGLTWPGKRQARKLAVMSPTGTLKPVPGEGIDEENTKNIFIEGDNLEVLRILQKSYAGRVKMIYIDPPYNTGKDFIYKDDFSESVESYLRKSGQADENGLLTSNPKASGRYHSNWLSMMYPRLSLARNLLRNDGVIFISIDDNEVTNLRKLCDDIFGEENFVGIFSIKTTPNARDYGHIGKMHEYCLFYTKSQLYATTYLIEDEDKTFKFSDEIGEFNIHPLYNSNEAFTDKNRPNLYYPFYLYKNKKISSLGEKFYEIGLENKENSVEIFPPLSQKNSVQFVWRWGKEKSNNELNKEIIGYKNDDGEYRIVQKMRTSQKIIRSMLDSKDYTSRRGTAEAEEIFGDKIASFPKPTKLIEAFLMAGTHENDIVLDFFSGSATTADAVLQLNERDKLNRKWICVQLPEPTFEMINGKEVPKKELPKAYKSGYKTIADIGKDRIRKVIRNMNDLHKNEIDSENASNQDKGFKVFKLEKSNFEDKHKSVKKENSDLFESSLSSLSENYSVESAIVELMLITGFPLDSIVKEEKIKANIIYVVSHADVNFELKICLDEQLGCELVNSLQDEEENIFICLDSALTDQVKLSLSDAMKIKTL